jgi:basic membrane lipoprotein Med (substrate-binding protein (PBP1-ABC) superfamily)
MGGATSSTAKASPTVDFAIVDYSWDAYLDNLRGITFAEDEAGYLAGTLAGLMTQADVVGAVGGMPIPVVVRFVEGYRNGAQCMNPEITVLISYTTSFVDPDQGAQVAQAMIGHRADVIFGAGGPTGSGGVLTATQSGVWGIGVDVDEYTTLFMSGTVAGSDKLLSSAMKRVDNAVFSTISDVVHTAFTSGTVKYDLVQQGVGLAPFHETDPSVPQSVRDTLAQVEQDIIQGMIDVNKTCRNRSYLPVALKTH